MMSGDTSTENRVNSDDFYVFNTGTTDGQNTMELMIEDKLVNIVTDSGASCNLMSATVDTTSHHQHKLYCTIGLNLSHTSHTT